MVLLSWPIRSCRTDDLEWVDCVGCQSGAVTVWVPGFGQGITEVRLRNSEWSGDRNLLANPNEISPNNYRVRVDITLVRA